MTLWMPANCPLDKSYVEIMRCQSRRGNKSTVLLLQSEIRAALRIWSWFIVTNIMQLQLGNYYCCCASF